jgi:hypothetical protein
MKTNSHTEEMQPLKEQEHTAVAEVRGGMRFRSAHSEVLHEAGILTILGFAAKNIDDNFTHPCCNLGPRPRRRSCGGKIRFVAHDPSGEFGYSRHLFGELCTEAPRGCGGKDASGYCCQGRQPEERDVLMNGQYSSGEASHEGGEYQQAFQPLGPYKLGQGLQREVGRELLKERLALGARKRSAEAHAGLNLFSLKCAAVHDESAQDVEGSVGEACLGCGRRHFSERDFNKLPWRENFLRFGIFDSDVKSLFDGHQYLNTFETHISACGLVPPDSQAEDPFRYARAN